MPQPRSSESLTHLCVQNIANNLDKFHSSSAGRRISLTRDDKDIGEEELSGLECLPSPLVVSIMDAALIADCTASKDKNLLDLLITTHLDTLDLTPWITSLCECGQYTELDDDTILYLLRRAALKHLPLKDLFLRFSFHGEVPCLVFNEILPAFPNLRKLDVSCSSDKIINDDFLALIATCCLNLEALSLICCGGVSDVGIEHLCGSHEGSGGVDRGCKSLVRLNVEGTRVTRRGGRLALQHLPRLQIFDGRETLHIAAEMHQADGTRHLNLKNLNASGTWEIDKEVRYVRGSLMADALRLCPFVNHVALSRIGNLDDADLAGLLNLKCLKKLVIVDCKGISFEGGLFPILKKFGRSSLESLILSSVPEVNIGSILEFCSNLREILLAYIQRYIPSRPGLRRTSPPHHLLHLWRLTIRGHSRDDDQPPQCDLLLLLSSAPALEKIELQRLCHFNDGILAKAMAQHGFRHLESFRGERCPGITKHIVDLLLEMNNPLSLIAVEKNNYFHDCTKRRDLDDNGNRRLFDPAWGKKIRENNWDLKIQYCECDRVH